MFYFKKIKRLKQQVLIFMLSEGNAKIKIIQNEFQKTYLNSYI